MNWEQYLYKSTYNAVFKSVVSVSYERQKRKGLYTFQ